jgi:hypothetical protein
VASAIAAYKIIKKIRKTFFKEFFQQQYLPGKGPYQTAPCYQDNLSKYTMQC